MILIGLNQALYKGHSFRIGAATQAAQQCFSENCIQKTGAGIRMLSEDIFDCSLFFVIKGVTTNTANPFNEAYFAPVMLCLNASNRSLVSFSVFLNLVSSLMSVLPHRSVVNCYVRFFG